MATGIAERWLRPNWFPKHLLCRTPLPSMALACGCGRTIDHLGTTRKCRGFRGIADRRILPTADYFHRLLTHSSTSSLLTVCSTA